jgi:hypothetical protein
MAPHAAPSVGVASPKTMLPSARGPAPRRHQPEEELLPDLAVAAAASLILQRRPEGGIDPAADHRVGGEEERQQQARDDRRGEERRHRHFQHRAHHHQHDRGRDEDAERAAGGDQARGELHVVAGADHRLAGHDAEDGDRGADDAGRSGEDGGDEHHREVERAGDAREHLLHRVEQALHQVRLLHHDAHEDEERHRGQRLLHHRAVELQRELVEHQLAEAPVAEDEAEEDEGEGDGEAEEDAGDHRHHHPHADHRLAHCGHFPFRAACTDFSSSEIPCRMRNEMPMGTQLFSGPRSGIHAVSVPRSPRETEIHAHSVDTHRKMSIVGK